jgi:fatty acid desaturase
VKDGTTLDPSSTYRYGKNGRHEHLVPYAMAGVFRGSNFAWDEVKKRGQMAQLYAEIAGMSALGLALLALDWRFFAFAYLPSVYLSWIMTHVENYYDHYRAADPANRFADSVSYYGKLFNRLYFNEGYHLEHHIAPSVHWTKRGELVARYSEEVSAAGSQPARFPSLLGFLE